MHKNDKREEALVYIYQYDELFDGFMCSDLLRALLNNSIKNNAYIIRSLRDKGFIKGKTKLVITDEGKQEIRGIYEA
jgi:hypothetical protein